MARKHSPDHERYQPVDAAFMRSVPFAIGGDHTASEESPPPSEPATEAEQSPPESLTATEAGDASEEQPDTPPVPASEPQAPPAPERLSKPLRFLLPRSERAEVMRVVSGIGEQLETSVEWSHVGRALVLLLRHAENEVIKHSRRSESLVRPPNDDALALAEFDQQIAHILWRAFRETPPLR